MTSLFVNMILVLCVGFLWLSPLTMGSVLPEDASADLAKATPLGTSDLHEDFHLHQGAEDNTPEDPIKVDPPAICATDSYLAEGICKCNHSACEKPSCERILNLATNGTDNPGHCCPTYTCDDCVDKHLIDGQCVCPEESTINEKGICECDDQYKTIANNTCECDQGKCPLPELCIGNRVGVRQQVGCCTSVKCVDCPEDSYPKEYNSDLIEDICVCHDCLDPPICKEGFELHLTKRGRNIPGNCCDEFECISSYCSFDGNQYKNGEKWFTDDNSECSCNSGIPECYPLSTGISDNNSCLVNNSVVPHHHSWLEEDGCTNCTCNNGEPICTAHFCNIKHTEVPTHECPSISCKRPCKYGYKYKYGCQTCKCKHNNVDNKESSTESNLIVKFKLLEEFMKSYNLTEEETIRKLQDYYRSPKIVTSTTLEPERSTMDSTVYAPENTSSPLSDTNSIVMVVYVVVAFAVGFVSGLVLYYFYKKSSSKKYNNNNNICPKSYSLTGEIKNSEKKPLNDVTR